MSLLQEYEQIRKQIGYEKYDMIERYLNEVSPKESYDKYDEELRLNKDLPFDVWMRKEKELRKKYGVILLDDILYKKEEWEKYEIWYNENIKNNRVEVLNTWETDYGDIRCNVILYKENKMVANIIGSYDECDIRHSIGNTDSLLDDDFVKRACKFLIYDEFDNYLRLPKITKCSKLLQDIYDEVCKSENSMCYITDEDWEEFYSDKYSEKDIKKLEQEIKKYHLWNVIEVCEKGSEYRILGYSDLETEFNDNREIYNIKNLDIFNSGGYIMIYTGKLDNGYYYAHSDLNDIIKIYDKKPFTDDYYEDEYEWDNKHLVKEIPNNEAKELFIVMNNLVDKVVTEPKWNEIIHNHFQEMISQRVEMEYM